MVEPASATHARRQTMLERIGPMLACARCHAALVPADDDARRWNCRVCDLSLFRRDGRYDGQGLSGDQEERDWLNRAKGRAKRLLGRFYPAAIHLLSPVLARRFVRRFLRSFDLDNELVLDLGSGTRQYDNQVGCVDGFCYDNVHLVCDLARLPLRNDSIDGLLSIAVLEHTDDPAAHVAEMYRVLKPGGRVLCYVPFIVGYHASPDDYFRFTRSGARRLFAAFDNATVHVGAGPMSGVLWVVQEWLAIVLSFGIRPLYRLVVPLTWILSPLKLADLALVHHPAADVIASGFFVEARKPASPGAGPPPAGQRPSDAAGTRS